MNNTQNSLLLTELPAEESATINGACRYRHPRWRRRHNAYRPSYYRPSYGSSTTVNVKVNVQVES
ncbi:MAG TPA: hypothetical protein V6D48_18785 [Oculatellaceae cyanobacterium]